MNEVLLGRHGFYQHLKLMFRQFLKLQQSFMHWLATHVTRESTLERSKGHNRLFAGEPVRLDCRSSCIRPEFPLNWQRSNTVLDYKSSLNLVSKNENASVENQDCVSTTWLQIWAKKILMKIDDWRLRLATEQQHLSKRQTPLLL